MPRKKLKVEKQTPGASPTKANPQLIRLEDLIPRKDVAGGRRLFFGAVNSQAKKQGQ